MATVAPTAPVTDIPTPAAPVAISNSVLYVGDLDRDVAEAQLFELFTQIGPVQSVRVCRDAVTRRSLGYAYVNYNGALDPQAAARALEALNFTPLNGKPIRIMWSLRDPSSRKSGLGNIFIKNLDKSIDNKALHDTFSAFGRILSCKVGTDANGNSKGYGFVHFETEESAQLSISKVNGMMIEDKVVYVGPFQSRDDRPATKELFSNVYIKNLPNEDTNEDLAKLVGEFGEVTSAVIMKDDKGVSKCFGFVNFKDPESAAKCVETLQGKEHKSKVLYAGRAQKKSERQAEQKAKLDEKRQERIAKYQGMNLYVKNLADDVDDEALGVEFSAHGTITSARVMKDGEKGKSKGFGFVCLSSHEEAAQAVAAMHGKMLKGKPLYVALAQRKEVRKVQLEQQAAQRMMARPQGPMPPGGMGYGGPMPFMAAGPGGMAQQRPGAPGVGYFPTPYPAGGPRNMSGPRNGGPGRQGPGMGYPQQGGYGAPAGYGTMVMPGPGRGRGGPGGPGRGQGRQGNYAGPEQGVPQGFQGRAGRGQGRGGPTPARGMSRGPAAVAAPGAVPPPPPVPLVAPVDPGSQPLNTAMLAAAAPEQQKTMIGERLFPLITKLQPELAGKITGMLLEMDNQELLILLESNEALAEKVDEAIKVLKEHNAIPQGIVV
ncbi:hypothetical protein CEUSTIGMA_g12481.t1 [Chlamydomonas eustigma]|uniref:Polyadenylate-binding protein n=1 Tax=Chlamydomonas eustigma TaxID=1157962 RepID=A0A250XPQ7_9CHLO|nr:hypothetical protein CEUSTIGMA_g12481.t1 [Chlamydomonas eustigma]|eukprot:GAX85061.1 hypothetical protein CEUSTIGMA_g12481.t1 [Chlamydomonas eustigma]